MVSAIGCQLHGFVGGCRVLGCRATEALIMPQLPYGFAINSQRHDCHDHVMDWLGVRHALQEPTFTAHQNKVCKLALVACSSHVVRLSVPCNRKSCHAMRPPTIHPPFNCPSLFSPFLCRQCWLFLAKPSRIRRTGLCLLGHLITLWLPRCTRGRPLPGGATDGCRPCHGVRPQESQARRTGSRASSRGQRPSQCLHQLGGTPWNMADGSFEGIQLHAWCWQQGARDAWDAWDAAAACQGGWVNAR